MKIRVCTFKKGFLSFLMNKFLAESNILKQRNIRSTLKITAKNMFCIKERS